MPPTLPPAKRGCQALLCWQEMDMDRTAAENRGMANRPAKARRREKREPPPYFIGEWIRALGARPRDVAKGANVNEGYLSQLISGEKKNPGNGLLLDIAKY